MSILKGKRKYSVAYVDPEFHRMLKIKCAEQHTTIVDYTKKIAQLQKNDINQNYETNKIKKRRWDFEF